MLQNLNCKFLFLLGFFIFVSGCQICFAQEKPNYLTFAEVLNKLTFASRIDKTKTETNQKLIEQIIERKVEFILTKDDEEKLRKADGNQNLIDAINKNIPEDVKKKRLYEQEQSILYKRFIDNYAVGFYETTKIALDAAKEFLRRYGDDEEASEVNEYFKKIIPEYEKKLKNMLIID